MSRFEESELHPRAASFIRRPALTEFLRPGSYRSVSVDIANLFTISSYKKMCVGFLHPFSFKKIPLHCFRMFLLLLFLWPVKGKEAEPGLSGPVCTLRHKKKLKPFIFKGILEKFPLFRLHFVHRPRPALSKNRDRTKKSFMISETPTYVKRFVCWIH